MTAITVNVPRALLETARRVAVREGVTLSELFREALFFYILHNNDLPPPPPAPQPPAGRRRSVPLPITVTPVLLARLDRWVKGGYFHSRSEAIRIALSMLLNRLERHRPPLEVGYR